MPVKDPDSAKTRLAGVLSPAGRRALVIEMFTSTVRACLSAYTTRSVTVVTPDAGMAARARGLGAGVVMDPPPSWPTPPGTPEDPHNRALAHALPARVVSPVGVVTADLPSLTADVLAAICTAAVGHRQSIVSDHHGHGTTMVFWTPAAEADHARPLLRFGPASAALFVADGAVPLTAPPPDGAASSSDASDPWAGARRDVDTADDLRPATHPATRPTRSDTIDL